MKKIVHRSVIPIYVSAGVWLIASLVLPMYRLWHYLLYAAVAVGGYFLARHFFPGTVEEVELPPDSGNQEVDQLILTGRVQQKQLKALSAASADPQIQAVGSRLYSLCGKIFDALEQDTEKLDRTKRFLNYYLPTTVKLLERHQALERQNLSGDNISSAMEKIKAMLKTVELAFQKQLDNLYEADAMDISADIRVMEQIMASEGLLQDDEQTI